MFRSSHVAIWLSRREERKILRLCQSHLDQIVETVKGMKDAVYAFCDENFNVLEEKYKKTFDCEREADDIKHKILQEVSTGPLHPIDREEVIRLVLTADDIAENAKSGSRKLRMASTECLTGESKAHFKEMADMCLTIVEKVRIAFENLGKSTTEAIKAANEAEMIEETIDEFRLGLLKMIMSCQQPVSTFKSLGPWLMLLDSIENMEDVSDRAEDLADVIRSIAILG